MTEPQGGASRVVILGATLAILVLCVFQAVWALRTRAAIEETKTALAAVDRLEEKLDKLAADQEFLVDDIARIGKQVSHVVSSLENRGGTSPGEGDDQEAPQIDWTDPQLFEQAKKSCAEYGIDLTQDEIRVPSRLVVSKAAIEYFGVLKGGKEHETLIAIVGNVPKGERRPRDFGARLNVAVQALGFKRGRPVRYTEAGRTPAQGETAYLFVEWEEKGEKVLVRAEDLIWNRVEDKPMPRGKWIYVGSVLVKTGPDAPLGLAADLEGEVIATYSSPATIFDNTSQYEGDDTVFLAAGPRIPEDVVDCTLVIRRKDREATRTFKDPRAADGDAPKAPGTPNGKDR
jgi:hypothetical protein